MPRGRHCRRCCSIYIYINSCIIELEQMAHAKAVETGGPPYGLYVPVAVGDVIDRILSLWFADDSTVVETDIVRLQWLVDTLCELLRRIDLCVNVRKTKLLITMDRERSMDQHQV